MTSKIQKPLILFTGILTLIISISIQDAYLKSTLAALLILLIARSYKQTHNLKHS